MTMFEFEVSTVIPMLNHSANFVALSLGLLDLH